VGVLCSVLPVVFRCYASSVCLARPGAVGCFQRNNIRKKKGTRYTLKDSIGLNPQHTQERSATTDPNQQSCATSERNVYERKQLPMKREKARARECSEETNVLSCLWLFGLLLKTEHMGKPWNNESAEKWWACGRHVCARRSSLRARRCAARRQRSCAQKLVPIRRCVNKLSGCTHTVHA
jgi:hypothetical protein